MLRGAPARLGAVNRPGRGEAQLYCAQPEWKLDGGFASNLLSRRSRVNFREGGAASGEFGKQKYR
jgi:hypothetical protein